MKGSYFAELGREFSTQNPVYTLRTMPENMFLLDGHPAFETWTGGLLAVLGQRWKTLRAFICAGMASRLSRAVAENHKQSAAVASGKG
jgi:hypothetical protein